MSLTGAFTRTAHFFGGSPLMATAVVALSLVDLAGGFALGLALYPKESTETSVHHDWRPPTLAKYEPAAAKPTGSYQQTLGRPIFSKTRRPFVGPQPTADAPSPQPELVAPDGLRLAALAHYKTRQRAFIFTASLPNGKWFEIGDLVEGWSIAQIQNSAIRLQHGGKSVNFLLYPEVEASQPRANPAGPKLTTPH